MNEDKQAPTSVEDLRDALLDDNCGRRKTALSGFWGPVLERQELDDDTAVYSDTKQADRAFKFNGDIKRFGELRDIVFRASTEALSAAQNVDDDKFPYMGHVIVSACVLSMAAATFEINFHIEVQRKPAGEVLRSLQPVFTVIVTMTEKLMEAHKKQPSILTSPLFKFAKKVVLMLANVVEKAGMFGAVFTAVKLFVEACDDFKSARAERMNGLWTILSTLDFFIPLFGLDIEKKWDLDKNIMKAIGKVSRMDIQELKKLLPGIAKMVAEGPGFWSGLFGDYKRELKDKANDLNTTRTHIFHGSVIDRLCDIQCVSRDTREKIKDLLRKHVEPEGHENDRPDNHHADMHDIIARLRTEIGDGNRELSDRLSGVEEGLRELTDALNASGQVRRVHVKPHDPRGRLNKISDRHTRTPTPERTRRPRAPTTALYGTSGGRPLVGADRPAASGPLKLPSNTHNRR